MEEEFNHNPDDYDEGGFLECPPFRCYEVVEISPAAWPEIAELGGKRGVVTGFAYNDGECAAGDPCFLKRGPTPLYVDMEQFMARQ